MTCRSGARVAVITSLPASLPGEHGVSFLATDKSRLSSGKRSLWEEPSPPEPLAPSEEVTDFIHKGRSYHRLAFGI